MGTCPITFTRCEGKKKEEEKMIIIVWKHRMGKDV